MATTKSRINITADSDVESALRRAAKRDSMPVASKATELLRLALELEEDLALAALAQSRLGRRARYIKHERAWL